jgi:hypothetical protein
MFPNFSVGQIFALEESGSFDSIVEVNGKMSFMGATSHVVTLKDKTKYKDPHYMEVVYEALKQL